MTAKHLGSQTIQFTTSPAVVGYGNIVGPKEGDGPLSGSFDTIGRDDRFGEDSWEKAESALQKHALDNALSKAKLKGEDLDFLFAGDLLNQCIGSGYAARSQPVSFFGLYGACSTMAESLSLAAMAVDGGYARRAAAVTSSHFCTAERQYRTPLEYGGQRTPTAQWTVTGSGAVILADQGSGPYVTHATIGRVTDWGIKDANNMGAAMAPAAYSTIRAHLEDTGRRPEDYDLIVTGDLGTLGMDIVDDFFQRDGVSMNNLTDCGVLIFDIRRQDVHCGGSGCGCSAAVLTGYLLNGMRNEKWRNILFCGTGALLSPTSIQQGESVPCICHAVALSSQLPQ